MHVSIISWILVHIRMSMHDKRESAFKCHTMFCSCLVSIFQLAYLHAFPWSVIGHVIFWSVIGHVIFFICAIKCRSNCYIITKGSMALDLTLFYHVYYMRVLMRARGGVACSVEEDSRETESREVMSSTQKGWTM